MNKQGSTPKSNWHLQQGDIFGAENNIVAKITFQTSMKNLINMPNNMIYYKISLLDSVLSDRMLVSGDSKFYNLLISVPQHIA